MSASIAFEQFIAEPHVNYFFTHDVLEEPNQGLRMIKLRGMRSIAGHIRGMAEQEFIQTRLTYQVVSALYSSAPLSVCENLGVDFLAYDKARFAFRKASGIFHRIDSFYDSICYAIDIEVEDPIEVEDSIEV